MATLSIIIAPDARLKVKSASVGRVDSAIRELMDDMLESMYAAPGIGLSAIQVGVAKRVIVIDVERADGPRAPLHLADPEVVWISDEIVSNEEGCLSFPDQFAEVERPAEARIRYLDYDSERRELRAEGLLARCVLHEMDHLEGILFTDHLSALRRNIILRKLTKMKKARKSA